ncbi:MAG: response regulator [Syntrophaceae bacterium]|nr:response regulator [Syntrophaceae bacterium]
MKRKNSSRTKTDDLRHRAEERLKEAKRGKVRKEAPHTSEDGALRLLQELQVHQIELEMQNEELLRAQAELDASRARYFDLYDLAPVGYCTLSEKGMVLEANLTAATMLGVTRSALVEQPLTHVILPEDRDIYYRHLKLLFESSEPQECVLRLVKPGGVIFWVRLESISVQAEDGAPVCRVVLSNITDSKRAEQEKQILQERLQQADKMEAIGTLAGGIAHDFNNILMGIQGYVSLMLLDLDPSHLHYERLIQIEEQVQSAADLTKQLLGFARGGRYEVMPTDMNVIIKKTSTMFGRTKREISIHRKYGKNLWTVEVDRGQMSRVFINLYLNACQAMPAGGEICLETENVYLDDEQAFPYAVKPGEYVKITVTDTGTGMDEKTKERVFDPFFTTKTMGRGTGLGLATVYGIIKGHRGMIHVDSEPGHGTTFIIYLPASNKEVVQEKKGEENIISGRETILLVDDEKVVSEITKELLESLGYRIYLAGSGQEAVAVYMEKGDAIDLVILDMIMPGISGGETFDRLRAINPGIKVLLSSGFSIEGEAQEILDRGCNGFLQKPFRVETLSRKVREMLD